MLNCAAISQHVYNTLEDDNILAAMLSTRTLCAPQPSVRDSIEFRGESSKIPKEWIQ